MMGSRGSSLKANTSKMAGGLMHRAQSWTAASLRSSQRRWAYHELAGDLVHTAQSWTAASLRSSQRRGRVAKRSRRIPPQESPQNLIEPVVTTGSIRLRLIDLTW